MAKVSTYLNFSRNTEEAFLFFRTVFGGEFRGRCTDRFGIQWMFNFDTKPY